MRTALASNDKHRESAAPPTTFRGLAAACRRLIPPGPYMALSRPAVSTGFNADHLLPRREDPMTFPHDSNHEAAIPAIIPGPPTEPNGFPTREPQVLVMLRDLLGTLAAHDSPEADR